MEAPYCFVNLRLAVYMNQCIRKELLEGNCFVFTRKKVVGKVGKKRDETRCGFVRLGPDGTMRCDGMAQRRLGEGGRGGQIASVSVVGGGDDGH